MQYYFRNFCNTLINSQGYLKQSVTRRLTGAEGKRDGEFQLTYTKRRNLPAAM